MRSYQKAGYTHEQFNSELGHIRQALLAQAQLRGWRYTKINNGEKDLGIHDIFFSSPLELKTLLVDTLRFHMIEHNIHIIQHFNRDETRGLIYDYMAKSHYNEQYGSLEQWANYILNDVKRAGPRGYAGYYRNLIRWEHGPKGAKYGVWFYAAEEYYPCTKCNHYIVPDSVNQERFNWLHRECGHVRCDGANCACEACKTKKEVKFYMSVSPSVRIKWHLRDGSWLRVPFTCVRCEHEVYRPMSLKTYNTKTTFYNEWCPNCHENWCTFEKDV